MDGTSPQDRADLLQQFAPGEPDTLAIRDTGLDRSSVFAADYGPTVPSFAG